MAESNSEEEFCESSIENYDSNGTHDCGLPKGHEEAHKCYACSEQW